MNVFEFVIIIVLVLTVGRIIERRYAGRRHKADPDTPAQAADVPRLDSLEERIKVLERIVTDQGYELRQKFRDLET